MSDPHPKDFDTKSEYMEAVRDQLDYGYCNPMKSKFANEEEEDAEQKWNDWNDD